MKTILDGMQKIILTCMVVIAVSIVFIALQGAAPTPRSATAFAVEPAHFVTESLGAVVQAPALAAESEPPVETIPGDAGETEIAVLPTPTPHVQRAAGPRPVHVGIIAGHYKNDSGAICPDGLREVDINLAVAERVIARLRRKGYEVDLLSEFDPGLEQYVADALISVHSDSCEVFGLSGFKVARASASGIPDAEDRLVTCIKDGYAASTEMDFAVDTITTDMTQYHAFHKIAVDTPAAILELGFMAGDREMLVYHQDRVAKGIVDGIQCFLQTKNTNQ